MPTRRNQSGPRLGSDGPATVVPPAAPLPRSASWRELAGAGLILAAAWLAYHNSFRGPFIFDDPTPIIENPTIRSLWPISKVLWPPLDGSAVDRRPVVNLSLAINYALGGTRVWGYHLFNFAAHVAAAWALFAVARRTFLSPPLRETFGTSAAALAAAATVLWTVHPLLTNAVTYVIQRTEVLAGLFYLLTLYCVIRGTEAARPRAWYAAAVCCCLLAMGSKESAFSAPLVVLLYDRIFLAGSWREALRRRWGLYLGLAATWGVTALMLGRHSATFGQGQGVAPWSAANWWDYASIQFQSIAWYLRLSFWPAPLILDYGPGEPPRLEAIAPYMLFVFFLLCATAVALRYRPAAGFLGVWFFAILAPSSGLVPITSECAAEKRMYLPLAAVVLLVVTGGYLGLRRWSQSAVARPLLAQILGCAVVAIVGGAMIAVAVRRNEDYRSDLAIWQDNVEKRPGSARAQLNYGVALEARGQLSDAAARYREALRLDPEYPEAHNNLGHVRFQLGGVQASVPLFKEALRLKPDYAEAHNNLGSAWLQMGVVDPAVAQIREALRLKPEYAAAHNNLGAAAIRQGNVQEAVAHFEKALRLNPELAAVRENLADALSRVGRVSEAIGMYEDLLQRAPDNARLYSRLARLLAAKVPTQGGDPARTVAWAARAFELSHDGQPDHLDVLAAAYAAHGRFAEAVLVAEKALRLASAAQAGHRVREIERRLAFYRQGRDCQPFLSSPLEAGQ